jgi:glycosyltransferase involved in cell wall biosynthesis
MHSVNPEEGGPIEGVKQRAAMLLKMGHQVEVVTLDHPDASWLKDFPLPIYPMGNIGINFGYSRHLLPWLLANGRNYDGWVVNGLWQYQGFGTRIASKRMKKPYVVFTHGHLDPWNAPDRLRHLKKNLYWPWGEYRVLRDAAAVLFTSREEMLLARTTFSPYKVNERVVAYGTSRPSGDPVAQKQAFLNGVPAVNGKKFILYLSRIHEKKGCDLLIKAFAKIAVENSDLMLVMAGPDLVKMTPALQELAKSLGCSDRVIWPGMLSGDLKWGAFHASEAFALPSHGENFGIAVAEALGCGKPVLISNKVNIWREIEQAGAGIVSEDTVEGAESLLTRWIGMDPAAQRQMGLAAESCFDKNFDVKISALSLLQVLREVNGLPAPEEETAELHSSRA